MKIVRLDFAFKIDKFEEKDFLQKLKKFLEDNEASLELYSIEELKSVEELLEL